MTNSKSKPITQQQAYEITEADLPLSCPLPGKSLWNWHPKVYLPIKETGHTKCPYCATEYYLPGCKDAPLTKVYD